MGIRIATDEYGVKVWMSDKYGFPQYAVRLGRKIDDQWVNEYQPVRFRKGVELENGAEIIITDGFADMDVWKKNGELHGKQVWMILDFHYKSAPVRQQYPEPRVEKPAPDFGDLPDTFQAAEDDIPF